MKDKELIDFTFSFNSFPSFSFSFLSMTCNLIQVRHTQGCHLVVNEVGANLWRLGFNHPRDRKHQVFSSHMPKP
uniref:Putative ovule protein n=1 Tax=Solanum chacoense TaxID=4108 RepID=A0A0V0H480_SOLCH